MPLAARSRDKDGYKSGTKMIFAPPPDMGGHKIFAPPDGVDPTFSYLSDTPLRTGVLLKLDSSPPGVFKHHFSTKTDGADTGFSLASDTCRHQIFGYRTLPCTTFSRGRTKIIFVPDL